MDAAAAPLVGRDTELSRLVAALEAAAVGRPSAVLLGGDAGVGKTRLLRAAAGAARERGARVLVGHCLDLGDVGVPFLALAEVLGALAAQASDDDDVRAALAAHPALARVSGALTSLVGAGDTAVLREQREQGTAAVGGAARLQLFDAVEGLLADLAAPAQPDGPVVLVLEDLHWADASTRDLLRFLLARLSDQRLLVLGSFRAEDLHRRHPLRPLLAELGRLPAVARLDLGPLPEAALVDHLRHLLGRTGLPAEGADSADGVDGADSEASAVLLGRLAARSEGNPYYAEELLASGVADRADRVPGPLSDVLLARVESLSSAARSAVRAAAVAGPVVSDRLLRAVLPGPPDAAEDALREAVAGAVLVPGTDRYAFRHALLQEAVLDDLLPGERTRLHERYARELDAARGSGQSWAPAAELARHALAAHATPQAYVASIEAAGEACALLAPREALRHVEQALSLLPVTGWAASSTALAPDLQQREEAALQSLRVAVLSVPDVNAATPDSAFASDTPATAPGAEQLQLTVIAAALAGRAGELQRAAEHARRAVALAEALGDAAALVATRFGAAHHLLGADNDGSLAREAADQVAMALAEFPDAPGMPAPVTEAWLLARQARVALQLDDFALAGRAAARALPLAEQAGSPSAEADARATLAILAERDGDASVAERHLRSAVAGAVAAGDPLTESRARFNLASRRWYAGDVDGSVPLFEDVIDALGRHGLAWSAYGGSARWMLSLARYASGDMVGSAAAARQAPAPDALTRGITRATGLHAAAATGEAGTEQAASRLLLDVAGDPLATMVALGCRAEALAWSGEALAAAGTAAAGLAVAESVDLEEALSGVWLGAVALAGLADAASERPGARSRGLATPEADDLGQRGRDLARRACDLGQREPARGHGLGPEGRAWLARLAAEEARLADALGEPAAADAAGATGAWRDALAAFGYGHRYEQARCRWRLAEALLATGGLPEREEAAELLTGVHADAIAMGTVPLRTAVEALRRRARLRIDGDRSSAPGPLTERESDVLALVAEGLTNRQVGERLFISEKTVSVHLSNLMAKLGASGRAEAVALAVRRGLLAV